MIVTFTRARCVVSARQYQQTTRGQVNVLLAFVMLVVCFLACVFRCTHAQRRPRLTVICVMLLTISCKLTPCVWLHSPQ